MALSAIASAVISLLASEYGDDVLDWIGLGSDDEYDNPYIKKALKRLDYASTHGYRPEVLSRLRGDVNRRYGAQASSARASTSQRLMRQKVPVQIQEQVLRDLTTQLGGERMSAMADIDWRNEQVKMQALNSLMGGSLQVAPDTGKQEAFGNIIGTLIASLSDDKNKGSTSTYKPGINTGNYYNYNYSPSLGQSWAANRYKYPVVK